MTTYLNPGGGGLPSDWTIVEPDLIQSLTSLLFRGYMEVDDPTSAATVVLDPTGDAPVISGNVSTGELVNMAARAGNASLQLSAANLSVQMGRMLNLSQSATGVMPPVIGLSLCQDGGGNAVLQLHANNDGSQNQLAFFGAGIVGRQSAPTNSLAEVLAALRAYGLLAP